MIIGMEIAGDKLRRHVEKLDEPLRRLAIETPRRGVREIADMLRDESLAAARHRDRRLKMRASGDDAGTVAAKLDRLGREAARAAQKGRRAGDDAHNRIVDARHDLAIMRHDQIGDGGEALLRLLIVLHQRIAADIGACRDKNQFLRRVAPARAPRARPPPRER